MLEGNKGQVYYVHSDHLNTPRALSDGKEYLRWRWAFHGNAFGELEAETDPMPVGQPVEYNLRFPGQYFDAASGLHYNYFRDYEPGTGRYVQSDPIGLGGGRATYGYANASPSRFKDPLGLRPYVGFDESDERKLDDAIAEAKRKLDACVECEKGGYPTEQTVQNIKNTMDTMPIHYERNLSVCGRYDKRGTFVAVGRRGLDNRNCCSLAAIMAHEAIHYLQRSSSEFDTEIIERKCFDGCVRQ